MIALPRFSKQHPSRHRDCQRAVVSDLNELIERAVSREWDRDETIVALVDLLQSEASDCDGIVAIMADYVRRSQVAA